MNIHDRCYGIINVDNFLNSDDGDRKGLELAISGCDKFTCNRCSLNLIVLDAFFDYFIENLKTRGVSTDLIEAYNHIHSGQKTIHCLYNGGNETLRSVESNKCA